MKVKNTSTDFKEDPRFKVSNREAIIGCVIAVVNFIWWFGFAYGLGSKPVEDYTYIFGFPAWFFYSCVVGYIVITIVVIVVVKKWFKEIPLENMKGSEDL
ncbi:YhdT family protein [Bacillaceae bacterium S4-13-58]